MNDLEFDIDDCVARVRLRDQEAARLLVENLSPLVIGIVRRKLPRAAAEEDLVQEIFSKVFEKLDQYRGEVPFIHWVSRIAVNHSLNALRSQKARPEWRMADLPEEQEAALKQGWMDTRQPLPGHAMAAQEWVDGILATLDTEDCLLIRMLDVEEFSIAEVQETTGWSAAYIRLRAFRARQKLNKRFGRLKERQPTARRISSRFNKSQILNLEFEISC